MHSHNDDGYKPQLTVCVHENWNPRRFPSIPIARAFTAMQAAVHRMRTRCQVKMHYVLWYNIMLQEDKVHLAEPRGSCFAASSRELLFHNGVEKDAIDHRDRDVAERRHALILSWHLRRKVSEDRGVLVCAQSV